MSSKWTISFFFKVDLVWYGYKLLNYRMEILLLKVLEEISYCCFVLHFSSFATKKGVHLLNYSIPEYSFYTFLKAIPLLWNSRNDTLRYSLVRAGDNPIGFVSNGSFQKTDWKSLKIGFKSPTSWAENSVVFTSL